MSLINVMNIFNELSATTKKKEKADIIKKYISEDNFKEVVFYACDPFKRYKVTKIDYINNANHGDVKDIFNHLDYMASKNGCNNADKDKLAILASIDRETITIVNRIIKKDLRVGCSKKTFKKHFIEMPFFEIMTCKDNLDKFIGYAGQYDNIYWSRKKDGVRCWAINQSSNVEYISRRGLSFPNFNVFDDDIKMLSTYLYRKYSIKFPIKIDGEVITSDNNFNNILKAMRSSNVSKDNFKFCVFDIVIDKPLEKRYEILKEAFSTLKLLKLELLEHKVEDFNKPEEFIELMNTIVIDGDEGLVLKVKDSVYELKEKSKWWCKMKPTDTLDLGVIDIFMGKEGTKYEKLVGGLIVNFRDNEVRVGSGFNDQERKDFLDIDKRPSIIEVKFKEITPDGSLREPIYVRPRDDKDTTD